MDSGVTLLIDDFEHPESNGLGVTFAYVLWQMIRLRDQDFRVRITKPNNPYRDPLLMDNVWDYYFWQEPAAGPFVNAPLEHPIDLALSGHRDWTLARQQAIHAFAVRHIRLLPHIQAEVDSFVNQYFKGTALSVAVRATDKATEYRPMGDDAIVAEIARLKATLKADTVFLMTDSARLHQRIADGVGAVSLDIPRSEKSLHHNPPRGPYASGLWMVMDSFIAARAAHFAYTPSNSAVIPMVMGEFQSIHRINQHCQILPFSERVDRAMGLL